MPHPPQAPAQGLVRGPLRPRAPDRSTRQSAPHLHSTPQPPRSRPGDASSAHAGGAGRDWGEGKPRTCEAGAGAEQAVRASLGRKKAPGARGEQAPPPAARTEPAGVAPAARRLGPLARARPRRRSHLRGGRPDSFRASVEAEDRWVRSLPIPVPWRCPDPRAVQSAAAARACCLLPAQPDMGATGFSRQCERRSEVRASLAGPGPQSRLSPRSPPGATPRCSPD